MHRSHKHQKELPHWQKRRNELIDKRRKLVEKVFGTLKRSYGYSRVRYRGLKRNAVEMVVQADGLQHEKDGQISRKACAKT